jgi:hypothetical protein
MEYTKPSKILLSLIVWASFIAPTKAQWDASAPPVNTFTTSSNLGIGIGPVTDARFKLLTNSDPSSLLPFGSSLDLIPGIIVQRDFYTNGISLNAPPANILEVWKQQFTGPGGFTAFTPGPNLLKFVIDPEGYVGIDKMPAKSLDVAKDANIDGQLTVGHIGGVPSSNDALIVEGNVTFTRLSDDQYRNIRARTNEGALAFLANTGGEDGPSIVLHGRANSTFGSEGAVTMSCYGTGAVPGFEFNNYDPSGTGTWNTRMRINADGNVIIGSPTLSTPNGYNLFVDSGIITKRIKIALPSDPTNWSDFVFSENYKLRSIKDVAVYIAKNKHLPDVPSTKEVHENGLDLAQMDAKLLQKIEELTLYIIQQQQEIDALKERLKK